MTARTSYFRKTYTPTEFVFGLDSTQGYLEFADSEQDNKSQIVFRKSEESNFDTHLYRLKQLEKEGYIEAQWESWENLTGETYWKIKQMCLTSSGRELLESLQSKSKGGRFKRKIGEIIWVILTSIATTLTVLYIRGE